MFHVKDNLFFGRLSDGSVRILKFNHTFKDFPNVNKEYNYYDGLILDVTIDSDSWGSVVASVSESGEGDSRWYETPIME